MVALASIGCSGKVSVEGAGGDTFHHLGTGGASTSAETSASTSSSWGSVVSGIEASSSLSSSSSSGGGGAPPVPPLVEFDLGFVPIGTPLSIDVPDGMLGVTAIARSSDTLATVGFSSLVAPDGVELVTNYGIPNTLADFQSYGIATLLVPQRDASQEMPIMGGAWQMTLGDGNDGTTSAFLSVWMRETLDGGFHGGVIDVNVFAAPGLETNDYYNYALSQAFSNYAGLSLGNVHIFALNDQYAIIDDSNFYQALEQTAGAPGKPALDILAVSYLTGSLEGAAGVTPGAPSMTLAHGTHESGIFWMVFGDITIDRMVLRHETGHMAGLLHTSELTPGFGDALSDTPLCPDANDLDACPDYDNLMFPTGGSGALALSTMQQQVIAASALYRGIVRQGGAPAQPLDGASGGGFSQDSSDPGDDSVAVIAMAMSAPWAKRLPAAAARWLYGVGCGRGTVAGAPDFTTTLFALGGRDPAALVAIGADATAPAHVRQRALVAAARAGLSSAELHTVAGVAMSRAAPRAVRLASLHGVLDASPASAVELATALAHDADPSVAAGARRALRIAQQLR